MPSSRARAAYRVRSERVSGQGTGGVKVNPPVSQGFHHPAPLPGGKLGGEDCGLHRQNPAAAQGLSRLAAEAEGDGAPPGRDGNSPGGFGQLLPAVEGIKGQLLGQGKAEKVVFLIQRRHLPVQGGVKLGIDEGIAPGGAGQGGDENHTAKELPE